MRALFLSVAILFAVSACSTTVTPDRVESKEASFDGNEQNSGIIGPAEGGGFLVTPHFRSRYNALIDAYGEDFAPALREDAGLVRTPAGWRIDRQHMIYFLTMNQWRKARLAPVSK